MTEPVSNVKDYVDQAALIVGLPIPQEYNQGVVENFERIRIVAQLVMDFPLTEEIEIVPVFNP